jgi:hypothetical protein
MSTLLTRSERDESFLCEHTARKRQGVSDRWWLLAQETEHTSSQLWVHFRRCLWRRGSEPELKGADFFGCCGAVRADTRAHARWRGPPYLDV